ncbi:hypothetical protein EDD21DRAFT_358889 [Dissophora ornata]|nr:hypothetical protein EDD21DRAFT_358889 [Dissophora ornata]
MLFVSGERKVYEMIVLCRTNRVLVRKSQGNIFLNFELSFKARSSVLRRSKIVFQRSPSLFIATLTLLSMARFTMRPVSSIHDPARGILPFTTARAAASPSGNSSLGGNAFRAE